MRVGTVLGMEPYILILACDCAGPITSLSFVPNSWLIASCSADASVRVWDIRTGRHKFILQVSGSVVSLVVAATVLSSVSPLP